MEDAITPLSNFDPATGWENKIFNVIAKGRSLEIVPRRSRSLPLPRPGSFATLQIAVPRAVNVTASGFGAEQVSTDNLEVDLSRPLALM